jgi:hypothetical protein
LFNLLTYLLIIIFIVHNIPHKCIQQCTLLFEVLVLTSYYWLTSLLLLFVLFTLYLVLLKCLAWPDYQECTLWFFFFSLFLLLHLFLLSVRVLSILFLLKFR